MTGSMFFGQINCEEICMVFDLWKWGEENIPGGGEKIQMTIQENPLYYWGKSNGFV